MLNAGVTIFFLWTWIGTILLVFLVVPVMFVSGMIVIQNRVAVVWRCDNMDGQVAHLDGHA